MTELKSYVRSASFEERNIHLSLSNFSSFTTLCKAYPTSPDPPVTMITLSFLSAMVEKQRQKDRRTVAGMAQKKTGRRDTNE